MPRIKFSWYVPLQSARARSNASSHRIFEYPICCLPFGRWRIIPPQVARYLRRIGPLGEETTRVLLHGLSGALLTSSFLRVWPNLRNQSLVLARWRLLRQDSL